MWNYPANRISNYRTLIYVIKIITDSSANIIKITTDAQDIGTGSESLPVTFNGESFQIAFNVRYFLDGL